MDDTAQNSSVVNQSDPQGDVSAGNDQNQQYQPTYHSVLGRPEPQAPAAKEVEPFGSSESAEVMDPFESEPDLHPEVREAGVEVVTEQPKLTIDDHRAGLQYSGENTPHHTQPNGSVQLPMSEEEARVAAEKEPAENSRKWLGTLITKVMTIHKKLLGGDNNAA